MSGIKYEKLTGKDLIAALRGGACGDLLEDAAYAAADEIESLRSRLSEAEQLLFALRDGIAVADFGDWNLLDQVDSFRSGDSTASSASACPEGPGEQHWHRPSDGKCHYCGLALTVSARAADDVINAQHDETGRTWRGPRSQLPPRYFEVAEICCLDYPRCDCNSPPEPDNAPTLQPCGHPWEAQHDFKCILCSSPG